MVKNRMWGKYERYTRGESVVVVTKLKKGTFSHVESELYSYKDTLREIENLRKDIMFTKDSIDENTGGGRTSEPGQPTERIATRLATDKRLCKLEEIAGAIEKVYTSLPEEYQKLVRLKYWTRPQLKTWEGIAEELHVNRTTAMRWRDTIVKAIAEVLGWR